LTCGEEGWNATIPDPLLPPFLLEFTSPTYSYLTLPLFIDPGTPKPSPSEPEVFGLAADILDRIPEENPPLPPLAEITGVHRVAPSRRPGHRRPLGELPRHPSRPRVRSPSRASWGRRRRRAVDRDLIKWSSASCTPSVSRSLTAGHRLAGWFDHALPRAAGKTGWNPADRPRSVPIRPASIFLGANILIFFPDL
jgi:hypothetical protein